MSIYDDLLRAVEGLPKSAVERTDKLVTRKGYDTTGYQYQFLVNVMNEIIGIENWSFDYILVKEIEGKYNNGKPWWDITVDVIITASIGEKIITRKCAGGHRSEMYADALKGAITNGYKKTVALFGVGKKAYEGTIDEDYRPLSGANEPNKPVKSDSATPPRNQDKSPGNAQEGAPAVNFKVGGKVVSRDKYIDTITAYAVKAGLDLSAIVEKCNMNCDFPDMGDKDVITIGKEIKAKIEAKKKK